MSRPGAELPRRATVEPEPMSALAKATTSKSLLVVAASTLALAGCKIDNRPLLARNEPPPAAGLPEPGALDPGQVRLVPVGQVTPARAYPYAERAYSLDRAFYDLPPDYGFAYGDEEPWVWETADDSYMFAEPYGDDYRYYYYEPGYDYPYFVRDADYGYAYGPDGALIALFDAAGALISASSYNDYYPRAHSYWTRGYDMYQDMGRAPRQQVNPQVWSQRAPTIVRSQQTWINAPAQQPQWRQWRASSGGAQVAQRVAEVRPARMARGGAPAQFAAQTPMMQNQRFQGREVQGRQFQNHGFQGQPAQGRQFAAAPMDSRTAMRPHGGPQIAGAEARSRDMRFEQAHAQARAQERAARSFARNQGPQGAPFAEQHGRAAAFNAPDANMAAMARSRGGGGHEWRGGGGGQHMAQAPQGGGGGWHGGGHGGGGQPQPQAAPQPQQQQHGNGGGHGQGNGGDHDKKH
jgi:hypothetical protein